MKLILNPRISWYSLFKYLLILTICSLNVAIAATYSSASLNTSFFLHDGEHTSVPDEVKVSFKLYPTEEQEQVRTKFEVYKPGEDVPYSVIETDWNQITDKYQWFESFARFSLLHSNSSRGLEALGKWSIKSYIDIEHQGWKLVGKDTFDLYTDLPNRSTKQI